MLTNATILRIDTPGPATTGGATTVVAGDPISVRCMLYDIDTEDSYHDGTRLVEILTTSLRVLIKDLGALSIFAECQLSVQPDGSEAADYSVWKAGPRPKGSLSFIQAKLTQ